MAFQTALAESDDPRRAAGMGAADRHRACDHRVVDRHRRAGGRPLGPAYSRRMLQCDAEAGGARHAGLRGAVELHDAIDRQRDMHRRHHPICAGPCPQSDVGGAAAADGALHQQRARDRADPALHRLVRVQPTRGLCDAVLHRRDPAPVFGADRRPEDPFGLRPGPDDSRGVDQAGDCATSIFRAPCRVCSSESA